MPLAPSPTVSPVCLPSGPAEPSPGTPCYIAGWGSLYEGKRRRGVFSSVPSLVPSPSAEAGQGAVKEREMSGHRGPCKGCLAWQRDRQPTW